MEKKLFFAFFSINNFYLFRVFDWRTFPQIMGMRRVAVLRRFAILGWRRVRATAAAVCSGLLR